jgi:hypothetical protein
VFDEIDQGKAMMDKNSPKSKAEPAGKAGARAKGPGGRAVANAGAPRAKPNPEWWAKARSLEPATDVDPADAGTPVPCEVRGATRFMRRGDCLSQGGRPAR